VFFNSLELFFSETLLVLISGADKAPENPPREGTPNVQNENVMRVISDWVRFY
jgi:hypothetical protein